jgi:hypothetical protein
MVCFFLQFKWIFAWCNKVIRGWTAPKWSKMVPIFNTWSHMDQWTNFGGGRWKINYFEGVTQPPFSGLAQKNVTMTTIDQKNLGFCVGPYFGFACLHKQFQAILTKPQYTWFTKWMCHFIKPLLQSLSFHSSHGFRYQMHLKVFLSLVCTTS